MKTDDIISYHDLVTAERAALQKGMNFGVGKTYSVFLMSTRVAAPYADAVDPKTGMLIYEGHDQPRSKEYPDPKVLDQPLTTPRGAWTENGKFFRAAMDLRSGLRKKPELVKVYEKLSRGVWCYKGFFELLDAKIVSDGNRKVFKFHLLPVVRRPLGGTREIAHTRLIPSYVKVAVWQRDAGKCVVCGSDKHLHFDHDIPFSKGGSSFTVENVRLMCAKHNLEKSDHIRIIVPYVILGSSAASQLLKS